MAEGQLGNDDEFPELQPGDNNVLAELRQVVLVRAAYFLDEAVDTEAFQEARDLAAGLVLQMTPECLVL